MIKKIFLSLVLVFGLLSVSSPAHAGVTASGWDLQTSTGCGANGSYQRSYYLTDIVTLVTGSYPHSRADTSSCHTVTYVLSGSAYVNPHAYYLACYVRSASSDNGDYYWGLTYFSDSQNRKVYGFINDRYFREYIPGHTHLCGTA